MIYTLLGALVGAGVGLFLSQKRREQVAQEPGQSSSTKLPEPQQSSTAQEDVPCGSSVTVGDEIPTGHGGSDDE